MWVQLQRQEVEEEPLKKLKGWVNQGGVLWLDTELARQFGFRLLNAPGSGLYGQARVAPSGHPILEGLKAGEPLRFTLSPSRLVISVARKDIPQDMTLLLGWDANSAGTRVFSPCAIFTLGRGVVVYRAREIHPESQAGERFEQNLRSWSFKTARIPVVPKAGD